EARRADIAERERRDRAEAARVKAEVAAAEASARRKRKLGIIAGLLLLGTACVAGGWVAFEFLASKSPGTVKIISDPVGAEVWQENRQVGVTPYVAKHQAQRQLAYTLKAKGFEDLNCSASLAPGRLLSVQVYLRPKGKEPTPSVTNAVYNSI